MELINLGQINIENDSINILPQNPNEILGFSEIIKPDSYLIEEYFKKNLNSKPKTQTEKEIKNDFLNIEKEEFTFEEDWNLVEKL